MKVATSSERLISLPQFFTSAAPADIHTGCDPMFYVSPHTASGAPTCGLAITVLPPRFGPSVSAEYGQYYSSSTTPFPLPLSGGFSLVVYRALLGVGSGYYGKLKTLTGVNYGDQLILGDIGGGWGARFAIGNAGPSDGGIIYLALAELP